MVQTNWTNQDNKLVLGEEICGAKMNRCRWIMAKDGFNTVEVMCRRWIASTVGGYCTARPSLAEFSQKVTIGIVKVDWTMTWPLEVAGRAHLVGISSQIHLQISIYEDRLRVMTRFEFKICYKFKISPPIRTLCVLSVRNNYYLQECRASYFMLYYNFEAFKEALIKA